MAGYSDTAMRRVCFSLGAQFAVTEMISARAVVFCDKKTAALGKLDEAEGGPVAVQLFGADPSIMATAAGMIAEGYCGGVRPAAIDINMGCPVPKVAGNGEGAALMRNPTAAAAVISAVVGAVALPVTVKLRTGWDEAHKNLPEVAAAVVGAGAAALCIHGRTRAQMYAGEADWEAIAAAAAAVPVPVIGNGDVRDAASALAMLRTCGCHGVMVARGAVGNPFVFREIAAALAGRGCPPPTVRERVGTALWQLSLAAAAHGEARAVNEFRKQVASYIRGLPGSAAARAAVNTATTCEEVRAAFAALPGGGGQEAPEANISDF